MKKIHIGLASLLLSSCATGYQPMYRYDEILVVNNSKELIANVTIDAVETGRSFSCGNIAPLGICSDRFGSRPYRNSPLEITWAFGSRAPQIDRIQLEVPATFPSGIPLRGVLDISPQGTISAYFQQDTPVR